MQGRLEAHFRRHPDAEIILSQPGLGPILGARVLGEFGDDPHRYASAKARKNYAATSPITRQSGKKKTVTARHVHNDRLRDALDGQAFARLDHTSPGARAYYDQQRARGAGHRAALRQLANRLVGILHGSFIVTSICAWRMMRIATRGCTSRAASRLAQVRLTSWTVILRSPAFSRRVSKRRLKLRGSNGVPTLVVNTSPVSVQVSPAAARASACSFSRIRSAVTQMPGSGSVASEASVLVSRWSSSRRTR